MGKDNGHSQPCSFTFFLPFPVLIHPLCSAYYSPSLLPFFTPCFPHFLFFYSLFSPTFLPSPLSLLSFLSPYFLISFLLFSLSLMLTSFLRLLRSPSIPFLFPSTPPLISQCDYCCFQCWGRFWWTYRNITEHYQWLWHFGHIHADSQLQICY